MAPHERNRTGSVKGTLVSVLAIMFGIVFCTTSLTVALDFYCASDINHWNPVYPGAEVVQVERSGFFRDRAMGITQIVYYTPDDRLTVNQWYRQYRRDITSNVDNEGNSETAVSGISTNRRSVFDAPDDDGTYIRLHSECAYG